MATAQQFDSAEVGWEAAWLDKEARYFDDLADAAEEAEEAEKSDPIYRMPNTWQVDKTIADARSMARAYQDRTGCDEAGRLAFECGLLGAHLRELAHFAASVESDLLKELQLALNETCNQYHTDGHADRVLRVYGLVGEEA